MMKKVLIIIGGIILALEAFFLLFFGIPLNVLFDFSSYSTNQLIMLIIGTIGLIICIGIFIWYVVTYLILNNIVYGGSSPLLTDYYQRNEDDKVPQHVSTAIFIFSLIISILPGYLFARHLIR